jgi:ABC-type transport system substrate-binding protein
MTKKLKKITAVSLALVMILSLGACGSSSSSDGSSSSGSSSGGSSSDTSSSSSADTSLLKIGVDGAPDTLSPFDATANAAGLAYRSAIFDTLWMINSDNEFCYREATGYSFNDDGTELTITLREDAKFSDGTSVTAEDVITSFKYSDANFGDHTGMIDIDSMTAVDEYTVTMSCERTATMIEGFAQIPIISKEYTEDCTNDDHFYTHPMGSGPYMLDGDWSSGENMTLVRNPYYYATDEIPYDSIEFFFIAEETTRFMSLEAGELDMCYLSSSSNIDAAKEEFEVYTIPVQLVMALMFETLADGTPFDNENIRLAICHAVDVEAIVTSQCGSAYSVATSVVPSASWAYKNTAYTYDTDLAKEYLEKYYAETGATSLEFTCSIMEDNLKKAVCESIQGYLSQVGITMNIETLDAGSYFPELIGGTMTSTIAQYQGASDPGGVFNSWLSSSALAMNHSEESIQTLLDEACNSTASQEERTEMFYEVQDMMYETGRCLPICEGTYNYAVANESLDLSKTFDSEGWLTVWYIQVKD